MKPKKRPTESIPTPEPTPDNIEADHELFLQAFESRSIPRNHILMQAPIKTSIGQR